MWAVLVAPHESGLRVARRSKLARLRPARAALSGWYTSESAHWSPGDSPLTVTLQPIGWGHNSPLTVLCAHLSPTAGSPAAGVHSAGCPQSTYCPQPSGWQPSAWCTFHWLSSARSVARSDTPLGTPLGYTRPTSITDSRFSHLAVTMHPPSVTFKQLRHLYFFVLGIRTGPPPCPILWCRKAHTLSPAFESSDDASVPRVASVRPMPVQARPDTRLSLAIYNKMRAVPGPLPNGMDCPHAAAQAGDAGRGGWPGLGGSPGR
jgi:hypothetical protein